MQGGVHGMRARVSAEALIGVLVVPTYLFGVYIITGVTGIVHGVHPRQHLG